MPSAAIWGWAVCHPGGVAPRFSPIVPTKDLVDAGNYARSTLGSDHRFDAPVRLHPVAAVENRVPTLDIVPYRHVADVEVV